MVRRIPALALVFVVLGVVPAVAQAPLVTADWCYEVDHSGDNPFGSPSAVRLYLTLPPELAGTWVELTASGASGDLFGTGQVDSDGVAGIELPLFSYGDSWVTQGVVDPGGADLILDTTGLEFTIDASEPSCNPSDLVLVAPETTTTVAETTTTVAPTTTTTVVEDSASTVTEATTTTVAAEATDDDGWGPWWIPIGMGTILIIGGYVVFRGNKAPCEEELATWMAAQAECDKARGTAEETEGDCDGAEDRLEDLEQQKKDLCKEWPPACWESEEGGWIEESGDPSSRITQRDLHLRREALGGVWDEYRAGGKTAQEVEQAWKDADTPGFREEMRAKDAAARAKLEGIESRLAEARTAAREACDKAGSTRREADEACDRAARAKAAYDACMGAAATPEPVIPGPTTPEPSAGPTVPVAPGPGISTAPPPPEPPAGAPEDEPQEPACCPEGMWMGYGWTTGGIFGWGVESTIAHFICLCDTSKWITLASRSHRAGLALGGETSLFVAIMWGVPHVSGVPQVWASQSASGWDGDVSLGPSVSKGIKNVLKDAGLKQAGAYLKWAAKNKVPPSALDPRKLDNLKGLAPDVGGAALGTGRGLAGQGTDPRLIVVPVGAGLQVGVWHKWCESIRVGEYHSCGCIPVGWP